MVIRAGPVSAQFVSARCVSAQAYTAQFITRNFVPRSSIRRSSLKAAVNPHEVAMITMSLSPSHHALYISYVSVVLSARHY